MKKIIMKITNELESNQEIVRSWKIGELAISSDRVSFLVDGFKYQGVIILIPQGDIVTIVLDSTSETMDNVKIPNLVEILDNRIEFSEDYWDKTRKWFNDIVK